MKSLLLFFFTTWWPFTDWEKKERTRKPSTHFRWKLTWKEEDTLSRETVQKMLSAKISFTCRCLVQLTFLLTHSRRHWKRGFFVITWSVRCAGFGCFYLAAQKHVVSFPPLRRVFFSFHYLHEQITPNDGLRGAVTLQAIKVYKPNAFANWEPGITKWTVFFWAPTCHLTLMQTRGIDSSQLFCLWKKAFEEFVYFLCNLPVVPIFSGCSRVLVASTV